MSSSEALDEIWQVYQITLDCLKVASRSLDRGSKAFPLFRNTNFVLLPDDVAHKRLELGRSQVDNYLVLSLWTVFERQMYSHLQRESRRMLNNDASNFTCNVQKKIEQGIDFWKIDDVLDAFRDILGDEIVGYTKHIKRYRDWLTHRNPRKGSPGNVSPGWVYEVLSQVLISLDEHPDLASADL